MYKISKKAMEIQNMVDKKQGKRKRRKQICFEAAQSAVLEELQECRRNGGALLTRTIKGVALQAQREEDGGVTPFKASNGWLEKVVRRNSLKVRKLSGERAKQDPQLAVDYVEDLSSLLLELDLPLSNIFNADETFGKIRPDISHAWVQDGDSPPEGRGVEKEGLTILTCANASGI